MWPRGNPEPGSLRLQFDRIVNQLASASREFYRDRLISVAVFGSVGRGVMRPDSDVDALIVVDPLPDGRMPRVREFENVERRIQAVVDGAAAAGIDTTISPVLRTRAEVTRGSPLLLDMVEDARVLYDRNGFLRKRLDLLRARLAELGARRVWKANAWYWDLKPDYKPGDEFES